MEPRSLGPIGYFFFTRNPNAHLLTSHQPHTILTNLSPVSQYLSLSHQYFSPASHYPHRPLTSISASHINLCHHYLCILHQHLSPVPHQPLTNISHQHPSISPQYVSPVFQYLTSFSPVSPVCLTSLPTFTFKPRRCWKTVSS
ncbi:hypothetical protein E2C01_063195 [Portunus trituberculatus]|uniref:Uncharacterized protein n=1 Tax=Portunus trituberculatus TaxID=210409 RepID=A0A5B7HD23_PORTR|nr:hypothetical protein [Portunus trituberculatus]